MKNNFLGTTRPQHALVYAFGIAIGIFLSMPEAGGDDSHTSARKGSNSIGYQAPAGDLPAIREVEIDGYNAAVLPNGRLVTPVGIEVDVDAPKPFGLAMAADGKTLATVNSGSSRFSASLITGADTDAPTMKRIDLGATFLGIAFAPDGARFYVGGGETGNVWVGDTATATIIGSVNLNGSDHPLSAPLDAASVPQNRFKGSFPGQLALTSDGRYLYVVDQAGFKVHVVETGLIETGVNPDGDILEPNNFQAVVGRVDVGRYPFGIALTPDDRNLLVTHVGVFQFTHLMPQDPTGDNNIDYPLCYPGTTYPEGSAEDVTIQIKPVDPSDLPSNLRDPEGIRCGYVAEEMPYTIPGLGSPNVAESSSVYVFDLHNPANPRLRTRVKTGLQVGQAEHGIETYSGSHPNAIAIGHRLVYVANGNNDSISVLARHGWQELGRIDLALLEGFDKRLKGVQPVGLALDPEERYLYVAEAGVNAIAVVQLETTKDKGDKREKRGHGTGKRGPGGSFGKVVGHIPTGWWPSGIAMSPDGRTLFVSNARGRGAGPNNDFPPDDLGSPKHSVLGSVSIIPVPAHDELKAYTQRVYANNGFVETKLAYERSPIPSKPGFPSRQIKHVIFINKENATHDLLLGDIVTTRQGVEVDGDPAYSLGYEASPNHHELALGFAFSDNFFLEPSVSSDGHRWLTDMYTTEFEETHWPASYGGNRRDAGNDLEVIENYPGRLGFTDASGSPDPHDYNQHGGIYLHLDRHGKSFVNFGNGYEFAVLDEAGDTEPTGAREHVNIPMETVVRENSDHLFPTYNTHIPDAPLPEDPTRFNRFGRFKQVFESQFVDRKKGLCKLPQYVDLYYPNDHGGGAYNINPDGPTWSFARYVQDNDAALGLTADLISHSPCWNDTVIFVVEDDTQNGFDHVDGHRSLLLVISPWAKREHVSKVHASLSSVFKTIYLILGVPPLNQYDAAATDLREMFTMKPDYAPYEFTSIVYAAKASPVWIAMTSDIDFSRPDADELKLRAAIRASEGVPRIVTMQ